MADLMQQAAMGAVKKNLGPDPSMKHKVDLLNRLVKMREDMKKKGGPVATGQPVPRPYPGQERRPRGGSVPTRLPKPLPFTQDPNYRFGPPGA